MPALVMSKAMNGEFLYREKLWGLMTGNNSPETVQREVAKFLAEGYADYQAPIKPWVSLLLGRSYIFRSRRAGIVADLIPALMFISDVMHLHLMQTLEEGAVERKLVGVLMMEMALQDPKGPWGCEGMTNDEDMMSALSAIIRHIHVFVPNNLLLAHNVTVSPHTSQKNNTMSCHEQIKSVILPALRHSPFWNHIPL